MDYIKIAENHGAKFHKGDGGFNTDIWIVLDQKNTFLWEAFFNTKESAAEAYCILYKINDGYYKMNTGVHETHCCIMHGCKYMNEDCPVVLDKIKQAYICEQCNDECLKTVEEVRELYFMTHFLQKAADLIGI